MAIPYLAISDNTTTCTMLDGTSTTNIYRLIDFSFGATVESESELGNQPLYQEVECSMTLRIKDSTVPLTYTALQTLHKLLIQAHKFGKEEFNITPVLLKYQPKGSSLAAPVQAIITEYLNPEEVVGRFTEIGDLKGALDVKIKFKRQGQWIYSGSITNGTTSGYVNPNVLFGSTFSTASTGYDPLDVALGIQDTSNVLGITDGLILLASVPSNALVRHLANVFSGSDFTLVTDTSTNRAEGQIIRFTAPDNTNEYQLLYFPDPPHIINQYIRKGMVHIYGTVRNNSTSGEFIVRAYVGTDYCRRISIDNSTQQPRIVYFGSTEISKFEDRLGFDVKATLTGTTLDFDTFFYLIEVNKAVNAIYLNNYSGPTNNTANQKIDIKTTPASLMRPTVRHYTTQTISGFATDTTADLPYQGDAYTVFTGTTYSGVVVTTYANSWRGNFHATQGLNEFRITPTRYNGYLLPE